MSDLNKVLIIGNLTRDPKITNLKSGSKVVDFSIATHRKFKDNSGENKEETTFVDCCAYGTTAENIDKYFAKGRPIFVEGRLKLDAWEAADGSKRSKLKLIANSFRFIDRKKESLDLEPVGTEFSDNGNDFDKLEI